MSRTEKGVILFLVIICTITGGGLGFAVWGFANNKPLAGIVALLLWAVSTIGVFRAYARWLDNNAPGSG